MFNTDINVFTVFANNIGSSVMTDENYMYIYNPDL